MAAALNCHFFLRAADEQTFDTTISGPWMDRWELVHHNRHVAAHLAASAAGQQNWSFV